jgi:hypothetical protein
MKARFTYWTESGGRYLGYLNDYPDHWTQGESLDDLQAHLKDLFKTRDACPQDWIIRRLTTDED